MSRGRGFREPISQLVTVKTFVGIERSTQNDRCDITVTPVGFYLMPTQLRLISSVSLLSLCLPVDLHPTVTRNQTAQPNNEPDSN